MVEWRIYYGDGTTYDGLLDTAPATNVQVIVARDAAPSSRNVGRLILSGWDYYLYRDGWYGVNGEVDLVDHVLHERPQRVLKGRQITTGEYDGIRRLANADPDFPVKSARDPARERV